MTSGSNTVPPSTPATFPRIGLTGAQYLPQAGVTGPYWGEMTCTADDESRVIDYVLDRLPAPLRDYLVAPAAPRRRDAALRRLGGRPANQPGNKDGWSVEKPGWIIDSVGFAGPGARYTLAMMNSLEGEGGYHAGTDTVTQVAAILFRGHRIAAPQVSATPCSPAERPGEPGLHARGVCGTITY